ncbi:MAG TPA: DUF4328 domain-containing protein [Nocardioides sp.]|nr:DUF4328 domain-containing protein [Nocardioides sp.]
MSYYENPVPPQPNPYAAYPYQDSRAPRGLAIASAILAGAIALCQLGAGLTAPAAADAYARAAENGQPTINVFTAYDAFVIVVFLPLIAAYIVTCVWLMKSRNLLEQRVPSSHQARGKVWVWLGWWVPIVSLWFPLQVVRDIRKGSLGSVMVGGGILAGWWASWLIYQIGSQISGGMSGGSDVSDPSTFDALPWIEGVNTIVVLIALACWLGIIRQITRGQEALLATPAGSAPAGF